VIRLIGAEMFKMRKRSMTRILLYILIAIIVVLYLVLLAISKVNLPTNSGYTRDHPECSWVAHRTPDNDVYFIYFGCVLAIVWWPVR